MTTISNKLSSFFKNLKSDAVPRPPRSQPTVEEIDQGNNENIDSNNEQDEPDEIIIESADEDTNKDEKTKSKKSFFNTNKKKDSTKPKSKKHTKNDSGSSVNTQATGNVINIVNSRGVHMGNNYYLGNTNLKPPQSQDDMEQTEADEPIEKCNLVKLLLESNIKPEHQYIDYISKNLGKKWKSFFKTLGYSLGAIDTVQIDTASYGVSEARYKLLLDWIKNDDNGSLGRLTTLLWQEGEREIVKELAIMFNKGNNNM